MPEDYQIFRGLSSRRKTLTNFTGLAEEALVRIAARFAQEDPVAHERAVMKMQIMGGESLRKFCG